MSRARIIQTFHNCARGLAGAGLVASVAATTIVACNQVIAPANALPSALTEEPVPTTQQIQPTRHMRNG